MSLLRVAAALIITLLVSSPIVEAGPSDLSKITRWNDGGAKLLRRQENIEDSGANVTVTTTVPLNTVSSNQAVSNATTKIPYTSIVASAFSGGGGDGEIISGGAFAGRRSGRGTRNEIYGTARFGSGYGTYKMWEGGRVEYTPELSLNVSGRDFPHGFPPLRFGNYSGGEEYINVEVTDYPGINLTHIYQLDTITRIYLAMKNNQTWFILADEATLNVLNAALQLPAIQGGCDAKPFQPLSIVPSLPTATYPNLQAEEPADRYTGSYYLAELQEWLHDQIFPWNVLQFYRGSSIALGSHMYDNIAAHNRNKNSTDYWYSSPLNTTGIDMSFLNCLNTTIAAVAPIVNPNLIVRRPPTSLNPGRIAGVVIGSVAGLALILAITWFFLRRRRQPAPAVATARFPKTRKSGVRRGIGIGESPEDYELMAPATYMVDGASSHEPNDSESSFRTRM